MGCRKRPRSARECAKAHPFIRLNSTEGWNLTLRVRLKAKIVKISKKLLTNILGFDIINELSRTTQAFKKKNKKFLTKRKAFDKISKLSKTTTHQLERAEKEKQKKLLTNNTGYDKISKLLKTTKNIDN